MNKRIVQIFKYLLFLAIGILLLFMAFSKTDIPSMLRDIKNADFRWILASASFSIIAYICRAWRWNMLIKPLGYKPKLKNSLFSLMFGYLANLGIPRIGEISRCEALAQAENIPFNKLLGTVITERIIDVLCLLILLIATALVQLDLLGTFILNNLVIPFKNQLYASGNFKIYLFFALILFTGILYFTSKAFSKNSVVMAKFKELLSGVFLGIRSIGIIKNKLLFTILTILIWGMYFLMTYVCFFSIPGTSHLGLGAGLFAVTIGGIGMSAPIPGGFGFHYLVSLGLSLFGINQNTGVTFASIVYGSQTLLVLLTGSLSMFLLFLLNKKKKDDPSGNNQVQDI